MKLSLRLTTLAITAVALAGTVGAQQRTNGHPVAHSQAPRSHTEARARQDVRVQHYAPARAEVRGRNNVQARNDFRGRADVRGQGDIRPREDVRERTVGRIPVADHGRPLITRAGFAPARLYGGSPVLGESRFGARGFVPRGGLPFGWDSRVVFHGFFPVSYGSYCDAVPLDYNYLLPPMAPSYSPCLFGDRVIVYDRFSRSIVFVATI